MSDIAPSPNSSSSGEENGSGNSNSKVSSPPPQADSSSKSPPSSKGESSPPPSPSSGGSRSSSPPADLEDSSSSSSPPSPSGSSSPSRSSSSPSSQPSPNPPPSSSSGGNSNSSPTPSPPSSSSQNTDSLSNSSQNSGNNPTNSLPPPSKSSSPPRSPPSHPSPSSSSQDPPTESGGSSSSQPRAPPPPRSSPSAPQRSNNNESSQPSPRSPTSSSSPSPPPPTDTPVVFFPASVSSNGPPGSVAISPGSSVASSTSLPGTKSSSQVADAGNQVPASSLVTSNGHGDGSSRASGNALSPQSSQASSRVGTSHVAAAITGLIFVVVAIFFVVSRRKKRRSTDGTVHHHNGYSDPLGGGGANQSGMLYHPPHGASAGFSYGPAVDNAGGGGYYQSGIMDAPPGSKSSFSYEELTSITSNFSRDNVIGEGGFGYVYKGWLADGKCVAVKQLKAGSGQGEREFQAEVEIISRVHHRHLVSLVGYCVSGHHRMLIYEFVPNGTLEHHLHGRGVPVMDWPTRLRIAIGAAKGLAYLHEDCHPRIIHRDIKSANILLDYSFEAQVADFGLAKLSNDTNTHVSTRIMGTFGYLAPEYASSGKLTDRSDVFSFGVVLLELITGRKPVDQTRPLGEESLVEWARPVLADAVETGDLAALVDSRLQGAYNIGEMVVMVEAAAACVRHSAPKRPRMVQVLRALDDDAGGMSDLSNGVKVGQSRVYGSGNHAAAIQQLRLTAFATEEFTGEFEQSR